MRVLMISLDSPLASSGGGETRRRHLRYAARVEHLTVVVYTPSGTGSPEVLSDRLEVVPTRSRWKTGFVADAVRLGRTVTAGRRIDLITTQDPFTTGWAGCRLSRITGAPLLVQNHSCFFADPDWWRDRPLRNRVLHRLGRRVIRCADGLRVVNTAERERYLAMGIPAHRICVVPTFTDPAPFAAAADANDVAAHRRRWGVGPDQPVVLWVGRPVRFKRLPMLLVAMRSVVRTVPEARLVLVGDLSLATRSLRRQITRHARDGHVVCDGPVDHEGLPAVFQAASVYAHTSRYEGHGRVMVEAQAAGLPVVATDSAGVRGIITPGHTGYVVPPDDVDGLARRLAELLRDTDRAAQLGRSGRALARERFEAETQVDRLISCWRRTLENDR